MNSINLYFLLPLTSNTYFICNVLQFYQPHLSFRLLPLNHLQFNQPPNHQLQSIFAFIDLPFYQYPLWLTYISIKLQVNWPLIQSTSTHDLIDFCLLLIHFNLPLHPLWSTSSSISINLQFKYLKLWRQIMKMQQ